MELLPARRQPLTISLTSLIDVVFILLMFFMLTSSFTPLRALALQDGAGTAAGGTDEARLVLLDHQGRLFTANGQIVTDLQRLQPPLVLAAVGDARVQQLVTALERMQQAGLQVSVGDSLPASALAGSRP